MSKGVKAVVAVAAAVAIPMASPAIASAIGLSGAIGAIGGSAAVGSALGLGTALATKQNAFLGAAGGALGGALGGYIYGTPAPAPGGAAGAQQLAPGVNPQSSAVAQAINASVAGSGLTPPAPPTAPGAGLLQSMKTEMASSPLKSAMSAGQLALVLFNKPSDQLLPHEQQMVAEMAGLASTNKQLFEQRLVEAEGLIRQGTPKPEQAFAQTQSTVQRQVADTTRGAPEPRQDAARRAGAIEATRLGTLAAAQDAETAARTRATGVGLLPSSAPATPGMLTAPTYEAQAKRETDWNRDLASAVGNIAGSFGSKPVETRVIEYREKQPGS
jgi:hypothetical protein